MEISGLDSRYEFTTGLDRIAEDFNKNIEGEKNHINSNYLFRIKSIII